MSLRVEAIEAMAEVAAPWVDVDVAIEPNEWHLAQMFNARIAAAAALDALLGIVITDELVEIAATWLRGQFGVGYDMHDDPWLVSMEDGREILEAVVAVLRTEEE